MRLNAKNNQPLNYSYNLRIFFVLGLIALFFAVVVARLYTLEVTNHASILVQAATQHGELALIPASRGEIYLTNTKKNQPVLVSSVCTHLGCTVQNKLNKGRLLCPCHISYFDLDTGKALKGPAKVPLPMIPFVVEDEKIYIVKDV